MISGKKAKEFIEDMRHCGEPTSEDLIASVRHQLGADHHPSDTVIMRKSTVRMLAQRLEAARETIRVAAAQLAWWEQRGETSEAMNALGSDLRRELSK